MSDGRQVELLRHSLVSQGKRLAEIEQKLSDLFEEISELQRFALNSLSSIKRVEEHLDRYVLNGTDPRSGDKST